MPMQRVSGPVWLLNAFSRLHASRHDQRKGSRPFDLHALSLFEFPVTDRRCTDERWVRDLLVDGCLTYNGKYWCMCSTDLCNSGDFNSIRGKRAWMRSTEFDCRWSIYLGFDDCSNSPCPSGTVCLDTKDGFSCICPPWQDDCTYCERRV